MDGQTFSKEMPRLTVLCSEICNGWHCLNLLLSAVLQSM